MGATQQQRHRLFTKAEAVFGPEEAATFMEVLPADVDELATRHGVESMGLALRADMADLRGELTTEMAGLRSELRTEMADLRGELTTEMADLRGELTTEIAELRAEVHRGFRSVQITVVTLNAAVMATAVGLAQLL